MERRAVGADGSVIEVEGVSVALTSRPRFSGAPETRRHERDARATGTLARRVLDRVELTLQTTAARVIFRAGRRRGRSGCAGLRQRDLLAVAHDGQRALVLV